MSQELEELGVLFPLRKSRPCIAPESAHRASVSRPNIKRLETGTGPTVSAEVRQKAQRALEAAGVEFRNGGEPGVKLKAKARSSTINLAVARVAYAAAAKMRAVRKAAPHGARLGEPADIDLWLRRVGMVAEQSPSVVETMISRQACFVWRVDWHRYHQ